MYGISRGTRHGFFRGKAVIFFHVCSREMLRPLARLRSFASLDWRFDSAPSTDGALEMFWGKHYDLVLVDVEGEAR